MTSFCVIVEHQEAADWALVLTASRTGDQRFFTPFLFACDSDGMFAACPNADIYARLGKLRVFKTRGLTPEVRAELLKNAVADIVGQIRQVSSVLEHTRVGIVQKIQAMGYDQALPNFELGDEPAFRWLYEHKRGESAVAAMRVCRYLADKYGLGKLSLEELERIGEKSIKGEHGHVVLRQR